MKDFIEGFDMVLDSWWPFIISMLITIISAIRLYMGGIKCPSESRIDGQIVIITGSSSGIGLEVSKELASRGAVIILAVRNAKRGVKAKDLIKCLQPSVTVVVKLVDLSEMSSVRDFADQILREYKRIDVLINNAGIVFHPYKLTSEGNEITMATNYFGPFLLTHLLLPLLNKSENGRVINVSALGHHYGRINLDNLNFTSNYCDKAAFNQSKLALTIFTKKMAHSLYKKTNITFNSVSPGLVRGTQHMRNSILQKSWLTKMSVWPWMWLFLKSPREGSQCIIYLAVEPALHNVSGCFFSNCELNEAADVVNDNQLSDALYKKTCEIIGLESGAILENLNNQSKIDQIY